MRPLLLALASALALALAPTAARADVAPPEGYEETCTVADRAMTGTNCKTCKATSAMPLTCQTMFQGTKDTYVCQTWGATSWTELWCDGPTTPPPGPSCALASPTGAASTATAGGLLLALAALVGRTRRRR